MSDAQHGATFRERKRGASVMDESNYVSALKDEAAREAISLRAERDAAIMARDVAVGKMNAAFKDLDYWKEQHRQVVQDREMWRRRAEARDE